MRRWLEAHPEAHRTGLSRQLCAWSNWRNGVGRLKDMAARSLLLKLEIRNQEAEGCVRGMVKVG